MNEQSESTGREQRAMVSVKVQKGGEDVLRGPGGGPCLDFVCSTGCVDRYKEVIEPTGWRLENYLRNPVFQNSHKYGDVIFTLGRAVVCDVREVAPGKMGLCQRIEFATEVNPVARIAYGLYAGGYLSAVSVGFIPLRWEDADEKAEWRRRYLEQELLEVSAVAVPANPEALALACKEGAISQEDLRQSAEVLQMVYAARKPSFLDAARELSKVMRLVR
ncbi:MAG TPA: HK97 family phage prohead protease [Clostridia bacterium]|nr:HK97 family phage prohead protease [Clostridia bacterium]